MRRADSEFCPRSGRPAGARVLSFERKKHVPLRGYRYAGQLEIMRLLLPWNLAAAAGSVAVELITGARAHIDEDKPTAARVERLAIVGATDDDIADRFLVSVEWIRATYPDHLRRGRAIHRIAIRTAQFNQATKHGIVGMLIWLGRNILGQAIKPLSLGEEEPDLDHKIG